jgi:S-adenosylmethionine hydrolase
MPGFRASGLVTLLTDFGLSDPFVGIMHGVILSRFAGARIVDLAHGVAAQNVAEGAFWLSHSYRWFPTGTVHVAVVDPGVGTDRAALAIEADGHVFVAPDNGLCGEIAARTDAVVHRIALDSVGLSEPSRTFHGRDVFAPVAAEIASGRLDVTQVGPRATAVRPALPKGHVVSIDRFGNLITDIPRSDLSRFDRPIVRVAGRDVEVGGTYGDVPVGELVALVSSFETVEIAVRDGNASALIGVQRGESVSIREVDAPSPST